MNRNRVRPGALAAGLVLAAALAGCAENGYYGDGYDYSRGGYYGGGGYGSGGLFGGGSERVVFRCDDDRSFTARFNARRENVSIDAGRNDYDLRLAGRESDRLIYEGREDGRDVSLTVRRDLRRAYLRIEDGSDFRDCRASGY